MWIYTSPLCIALILGLIFMLFWLLICKSSVDKVFAELKKLEDEAKLATTLEELENIFIALRLFSSSSCWHPRHYIEVNRILSYMLGRIKGLK